MSEPLVPASAAAPLAAPEPVPEPLAFAGPSHDAVGRLAFGIPFGALGCTAATLIALSAAGYPLAVLAVPFALGTLTAGGAAGAGFVVLSRRWRLLEARAERLARFCARHLGEEHDLARESLALVTLARRTRSAARLTAAHARLLYLQERIEEARHGHK